MEEEIEYLEEYEDLVLPNLSSSSSTKTSASIPTAPKRTVPLKSAAIDSDNESSSSLDQDIFESLFDNVSDDDDDDLMKKSASGKRESLDSIDALVKDLGERVAKNSAINIAAKVSDKAFLQKTNTNKSFFNKPTGGFARRALGGEDDKLNAKESLLKPKSKPQSDFLSRERNRPVATIVRPEKIITKDPAEDPLSLDDVLDTNTKNKRADLESLSDVSNDSCESFETLERDVAATEKLLLTPDETSKESKKPAKTMPNENNTDTSHIPATQDSAKNCKTPTKRELPDKVKILSNTPLHPVDKELIKSISRKDTLDVDVAPVEKRDEQQESAELIADDGLIGDFLDANDYDNVLYNEVEVETQAYDTNNKIVDDLEQLRQSLGANADEQDQSNVENMHDDDSHMSSQNIIDAIDKLLSPKPVSLKEAKANALDENCDSAAKAEIPNDLVNNETLLSPDKSSNGVEDADAENAAKEHLQEQPTTHESKDSNSENTNERIFRMPRASNERVRKESLRSTDPIECNAAFDLLTTPGQQSMDTSEEYITDDNCGGMQTTHNKAPTVRAKSRTPQKSANVLALEKSSSSSSIASDKTRHSRDSSVGSSISEKLAETPKRRSSSSSKSSDGSGRKSKTDETRKHRIESQKPLRRSTPSKSQHKADACQFSGAAVSTSEHTNKGSQQASPAAELSNETSPNKQAKVDNTSVAAAEVESDYKNKKVRRAESTIMNDHDARAKETESIVKPAQPTPRKNTRPATSNTRHKDHNAKERVKVPDHETRKDAHVDSGRREDQHTHTHHATKHKMDAKKSSQTPTKAQSAHRANPKSTSGTAKRREKTDQKNNNQNTNMVKERHTMLFETLRDTKKATEKQQTNEVTTPNSPVNSNHTEKQQKYTQKKLPTATDVKDKAEHKKTLSSDTKNSALLEIKQDRKHSEKNGTKVNHTTAAHSKDESVRAKHDKATSKIQRSKKDNCNAKSTHTSKHASSNKHKKKSSAKSQDTIERAKPNENVAASREINETAAQPSDKSTTSLTNISSAGDAAQGTVTATKTSAKEAEDSSTSELTEQQSTDPAQAATAQSNQAIATEELDVTAMLSNNISHVIATAAPAEENLATASVTPAEKSKDEQLNVHAELAEEQQEIPVIYSKKQQASQKEKQKLNAAKELQEAMVKTDKPVESATSATQQQTEHIHSNEIEQLAADKPENNEPVTEAALGKAQDEPNQNTEPIDSEHSQKESTVESNAAAETATNIETDGAVSSQESVGSESTRTKTKRNHKRTAATEESGSAGDKTEETASDTTEAEVESNCLDSPSTITRRATRKRHNKDETVSQADMKTPFKEPEMPLTRSRDHTSHDVAATDQPIKTRQRSITPTEQKPVTRSRDPTPTETTRTHVPTPTEAKPTKRARDLTPTTRSRVATPTEDKPAANVAETAATPTSRASAKKTRETRKQEAKTKAANAACAVDECSQGETQLLMNALEAPSAEEATADDVASNADDADTLTQTKVITTRTKTKKPTAADGDVVSAGAAQQDTAVVATTPSVTTNVSQADMVVDNVVATAAATEIHESSQVESAADSVTLAETDESTTGVDAVEDAQQVASAPVECQDTNAVLNADSASESDTAQIVNQSPRKNRHSKPSTADTVTSTEASAKINTPIIGTRSRVTTPVILPLPPYTRTRNQTSASKKDKQTVVGEEDARGETPTASPDKAQLNAMKRYLSSPAVDEKTENIKKPKLEQSAVETTLALTEPLAESDEISAHKDPSEQTMEDVLLNTAVNESESTDPAKPSNTDTALFAEPEGIANVSTNLQNMSDCLDDQPAAKKIKLDHANIGPEQHAAFSDLDNSDTISAFSGDELIERIMSPASSSSKKSSGKASGTHKPSVTRKSESQLLMESMPKELKDHGIEELIKDDAPRVRASKLAALTPINSCARTTPANPKRNSHESRAAILSATNIKAELTSKRVRVRPTITPAISDIITTTKDHEQMLQSVTAAPVDVFKTPSRPLYLKQRTSDQLRHAAKHTKPLHGTLNNTVIIRKCRSVRVRINRRVFKNLAIKHGLLPDPARKPLKKAAYMRNSTDSVGYEGTADYIGNQQIDLFKASTVVQADDFSDELSLLTPLRSKPVREPSPPTKQTKAKSQPTRDKQRKSWNSAPPASKPTKPMPQPISSAASSTLPVDPTPILRAAMTTGTPAASSFRANNKLTASNESPGKQPVDPVSTLVPLVPPKIEIEDPDETALPAMNPVLPTLSARPKQTAAPPTQTGSASVISSHTSQSKPKINTTTGSASNNAQLMNSSCGNTAMYNFLYPTKYHSSYGEVLLDCCCRDLGGPIPAVNPSRAHSNLEAPIRELPAYVVMTTQLVTQEELKSKKNFIPASVRQKLQRSPNQQNQQHQQLSRQQASAAQQALSKKPTTGATVPTTLPLMPSTISALKKQLPSTTTITAKTGNPNAASLDPEQLVRRVDSMLLKLSHLVLTATFSERQLVIENLAKQNKYSAKELDLISTMLEDYEQCLQNKMVPRTMPLAAAAAAAAAAASAPLSSNKFSSFPPKTTAAAATTLNPQTKYHPTAPQYAHPVAQNVPVYDANNTIIGYQMQLQPKSAAAYTSIASAASMQVGSNRTYYNAPQVPQTQSTMSTNEAIMSISSNVTPMAYTATTSKPSTTTNFAHQSLGLSNMPLYSSSAAPTTPLTSTITTSSTPTTLKQPAQESPRVFYTKTAPILPSTASAAGIQTAAAAAQGVAGVAVATAAGTPTSTTAAHTTAGNSISKKRVRFSTELTKTTPTTSAPTSTTSNPKKNTRFSNELSTSAASEKFMRNPGITIRKLIPKPATTSATPTTTTLASATKTQMGTRVKQTSLTAHSTQPAVSNTGNTTYIRRSLPKVPDMRQQLLTTTMNTSGTATQRNVANASKLSQSLIETKTVGKTAAGAVITTASAQVPIMGTKSRRVTRSLPSETRQIIVVTKDSRGDPMADYDDECILPDEPNEIIKRERTDEDFIGGI